MLRTGHGSDELKRIDTKPGGRMVQFGNGRQDGNRRRGRDSTVGGRRWGVRIRAGRIRRSRYLFNPLRGRERDVTSRGRITESRSGIADGRRGTRRGLLSLLHESTARSLGLLGFSMRCSGCVAVGLLLHLITRRGRCHCHVRVVEIYELLRLFLFHLFQIAGISCCG